MDGFSPLLQSEVLEILSLSISLKSACKKAASGDVEFDAFRAVAYSENGE